MEKLVPKLRFSGFADHWAKSYLRELGSVVTGSTPQTSNRDYYGEDRLFVSPFDIRGQRFVFDTKTKLTEEGFKKCRSVPVNSVLVVCIGSTIGKVAQSGLECATNQQINAFIANDGVSNNFVYYVLDKNSDKIKLLAGVQAVPILNKTQFSAFEIRLPSLLEQTKIAEFLNVIDKRIELLTAKKEKLTLYKKGVMQKIFNQEFRFKDENGQEFSRWEETTLGEVTEYFSNRNKKLVEAQVYSVTNSNGFVLQSDHFEDRQIASLDLSNYKIVKNGDFAYNPARINVGSIAQFHGSLGLISSLYVCFKVKEILLDRFLMVFLDLDLTKQNIVDYGEGGVRIYLWYNLFSMIPIKLPSLIEQQKIADFGYSIDAQIRKLEQQITLNQNYKKGLLQQMFV